MTRRQTLGFDRKLELSWLDAAAAAAAQAEDIQEARAQLYRLLDGVVAGDGPHSGRGKTITVLSRVWLKPKEDGIRSRALAAIASAGAEERLAIHWAMCAAAHPFFVDVAAAVGRLLRLQGEFAQTQAVRRVAERWGDRTTLHRAVQRTCRTFIDWGVLRETKVRGVYEPSSERIVVSDAAARLLVEAILIGGVRSSAPLADICRHPALFPFELQVTGGEFRNAAEFRVDREGLDVDVVGLIDGRESA